MPNMERTIWNDIINIWVKFKTTAMSKLHIKIKHNYAQMK